MYKEIDDSPERIMKEGLFLFILFTIGTIIVTGVIYLIITTRQTGVTP